MRNKAGHVILYPCLLLLLTTLLGRLELAEGKQQDPPDLYTDEDDVLRLNSTTFIPTVYHQNKNVTFMVEFYNTFCGHCQKFAPIYKDVASRAKNWSSVIVVGGVDCSKDENTITCMENNVDAYPTIYFFPPNAKPHVSSDKPLSLRYLNQYDWTVDGLEEAIVDYVANLSSTRKEYPLVVEALKPVEVDNLGDLVRIYPEARSSADGSFSSSGGGYKQDLMFVVEQEDSYLGRKLILEYYRLQHKLELRRIFISNHELLKSIMNSEDYSSLKQEQPVLLKLKEDENISQVYVKGEASEKPDGPEQQDVLLARFKSFFEQYYSIELKELENYTQKKNYFPVKPKPKQLGFNQFNENHHDELQIQYLLNKKEIRNKRVFAIDLLKGIVYMLTHEVKIKGDLSNIEYNTVKNMLIIITKYLPLERWDPEMNDFVSELRSLMDSNRDTYEQVGVKAEEMRKMLSLAGEEEIKSRYSKENWVSCLESDLHHKGYTCSLWLLFHSLTAGEYSRAPPVKFRQTLVLYTMRDYITRFLGCSVCAENFEKETQSLAYSLNHRNSSVLWLWSTHNHVNLRLNKERTPNNRLALDEVIFPYPRLCPDCLRTNLNELDRNRVEFDDIVWDPHRIFHYLMDIYRPDRIVSLTEMASLLRTSETRTRYDVEDFYGETSGSSSSGAETGRTDRWSSHSLSTSDIGLCMILYIACIMIHQFVSIR